MAKKVLLVLIITLISFQANAQVKDISEYMKNFSFSTYMDVYYAYDTDKDKTPRQFALLSPYRDEFRLNIAQVSLKYNSDKVRGVMTLHYGDIPDMNWAPVTKTKYVQEANIGFSPVKDLWIDAGYFITHIGAESLPKSSLLSSFALGTYAEPFIQSGLRFSYGFSDKFYAQFHILNGYNVFEDNNKNKSFGVQLGYTPRENLKFVYNNIVGNEIPAALNNPKTRFYNQAMMTYSPSKKVDILLSLDYGIQEKSKLKDTTASASLFSGLAAIKYKVHPKISLCLRGEFYSDPDGFLSGSYMNSDGSVTGLKTFGVTAGIEYKPIETMYLRLESRLLHTMDEVQKIFYENKRHKEEVALNFGFEY
ncbi:MAG: outer membrane beta-barrel protein [Ignavibacteria bacterium]